MVQYPPEALYGVECLRQFFTYFFLQPTLCQVLLSLPTQHSCTLLQCFSVMAKKRDTKDTKNTKVVANSKNTTFLAPNTPNLYSPTFRYCAAGGNFFP